MIRKLWPLLIGFSIWALAFVALYAIQSLGCIWGWPEPVHRGVLIAIWIATLIVLCGILRLQWGLRRNLDAVLSRTGMVITTAAFAATVLTYLPVVLLTVCV